MAASRSPFTFHAIPVPSLDKGIAATADKRWEKFIKARDGKKGQSARAGGGIKRAPLHPTMWHKQAARAVTCTTLVLREGPDPDSEKKPGKLPSATEVFVIEVHSLPPRAASPGQEDTDSQPTGLPTLRALVSDSPLAASPPLGWVTAINDRCAAPLHTWHGHGHGPAVSLLRLPSSHHFLLLLPSPPSPSPPFTSTAHSPVRSGARLIEFFDEVPLHSLDHSATTDTSRASAAAAPPGFFSSWPPVLMFGTSASPSGSPRGSPLGTPRLGSARTERGDNGRHTVFSFPRQASCGASPFPFPLLLSESSCANVLSPKLSSTFHSPFSIQTHSPFSQTFSHLLTPHPSHLLYFSHLPCHVAGRDDQAARAALGRRPLHRQGERLPSCDQPCGHEIPLQLAATALRTTCLQLLRGEYTCRACAPGRLSRSARSRIATSLTTPVAIALTRRPRSANAGWRWIQRWPAGTGTGHGRGAPCRPRE